jgi:hypothetical protein
MGVTRFVLAAVTILVAAMSYSALKPPLELIYDNRLGGCRSWVEIPDDDTDRLENAENVLGQDRFSTLFERISGIVGLDVSH